jgi:hypothetical protein
VAAINHPVGRRRRLAGGHKLSRPHLDANWWLVSAVAVLAVSAMLPVVQNSTATSRGFEITNLQAQRSGLEGDLRVLESDVATLTSLDRVQRRAAEIGLYPAANSIWVSVDEAGPAPAKIPAEYLPPPARATGATDPWWRSLLEWLPLLPD